METELVKLLHGFFKENKQLVLTSVFSSIITTVLESIIAPGSLSGVINTIGKNNFKSELMILLGVWITIKVSHGTSDHFRIQIEPKINDYILIHLIQQVFEKYEKDNEISSLSVLTSKINLIKHNLSELFYLLFAIFIPKITTIIIGCVRFLLINKILGSVLSLCIIIQLLLLFGNFDTCVETKYNELEHKDDMYGYIEDLFGNLDMIQSTTDGFQRELHNIKQTSLSSIKHEYNVIKCIRTKQVMGYITSIIISLVIILTIYYLYSNNALTHDQITLCILTLSGILETIYDICYYIPDLTQKVGILKNNENFLRTLTERKYDGDDDSLTSFFINDGSIKFNDVSFSYDTHSILNNFSLILPENKLIMLFGPSGTGKSTFVKLLFRVIQPDSGNITIDGQDINQCYLKDVRQHISYLNQNSLHLFNKTFFQNVTYGYNDEEDADLVAKQKEQLKNLILTYNLYPLFKNLDADNPQWTFLDQSVGRLGENLSGGQKQVVHLLRLDFNPRSKIVLLDEPTSALDDATRNNVIRYFQYLNSKSMTILIITHDMFYNTVCDYKLTFVPQQNPSLEQIRPQTTLLS